MRDHGGTPARLEQISAEVRAGRAEQLIGVCVTCEERHWFGVDEIGEPCPADVTEGRTHAVNYYVLCDVRRT